MKNIFEQWKRATLSEAQTAQIQNLPVQEISNLVDLLLGEDSPLEVTEKLAGRHVKVSITADGDIMGIDAFKAYYNNYLTGFSDAEFNIVDVFGQGDKIVKHWNFKGTHDGDFFGIPPTGKKIDLIGTTLVLMKDGKILEEQDFFDNYSLLSQLGLLPTE